MKPLSACNDFEIASLVSDLARRVQFSMLTMRMLSMSTSVCSAYMWWCCAIGWPWWCNASDLGFGPKTAAKGKRIDYIYRVHIRCIESVGFVELSCDNRGFLLSTVKWLILWRILWFWFHTAGNVVCKLLEVRVGVATQRCDQREIHSLYSCQHGFTRRPPPDQRSAIKLK